MTDENIDTLGNAEGDTPEYIAEMTARAEGQPPAKPAEGDAGEGDPLLAGKFKTPEDLEKGYLELQARFSSRPAEENTGSDNGGSGGDGDDPEETPKADLPERTEDTPEGMPEGIDFNKYSQSIADNGSLTEDDYTELSDKHNLPREVVDMYVKGIQSAADDRSQAAIKAVGSEEEFTKVRDWASTNLNDNEYNATRKAIAEAKTPEDVAVIYGMLAQRYRTANPGEPNLISGDGGVTPTVAGYRSRAEMTAAINDPRYQTDDAYRKDVEAKVGKSNLF